MEFDTYEQNRTAIKITVNFVLVCTVKNNYFFSVYELIQIIFSEKRHCTN